MQYCLPSPVECFGDSGNVEQYFWALKTFKNSDCDSLNASSHMDLQGTFNVWLFLASQGGAISMQMIFRSVELTSLSWKIALDSTICWYASDTDVKLYPAFWHCFMASRVHLTASGKKTQKSWYKRKKKNERGFSAVCICGQGFYHLFTELRNILNQLRDAQFFWFFVILAVPFCS